MADDEEVVEEAEEVVGGIESEIGAVSPAELVKPLPPPKYEVRPGLGEKFQAQNIREIILSSMQAQLLDRQYRADQAPRWVKTIANSVRQRVQELDMKRYKIIVQTLILEMKGAGIKCGQRCIWDPETDDYVDDIFKSETIYCYTIVYGVYMY